MSDEDELKPDWSTIAKIVLEVTYRDELRLDRVIEDVEDMLETGQERPIGPAGFVTQQAMTDFYMAIKTGLRGAGFEGPVLMRSKFGEEEDETGTREKSMSDKYRTWLTSGDKVVLTEDFLKGSTARKDWRKDHRHGLVFTVLYVREGLARVERPAIRPGATKKRYWDTYAAAFFRPVVSVQECPGCGIEVDFDRNACPLCHTKLRKKVE